MCFFGPKRLRRLFRVIKRLFWLLGAVTLLLTLPEAVESAVKPYSPLLEWMVASEKTK